MNKRGQNRIEERIERICTNSEGHSALILSVTNLLKRSIIFFYFAFVSFLRYFVNFVILGYTLGTDFYSYIYTCYTDSILTAAAATTAAVTTAAAAAACVDSAVTT